MAAAPYLLITPEEYLALERQAEQKSEYLAGEIFAMAGGTEEHSLIGANIITCLTLAFRGRECRAYTSDMRVKVSESGLYTYPDVSALCGDPRFDDAVRDTLLNPTVVFEVLSPGTEAYDRGRKSAHYRRIESLREYVLVAQDRPQIDLFTRQGDGPQWVLTEVSDLDGMLCLASVQVEIPLADIYHRVDFGKGDIPISPSTSNSAPEAPPHP